MQTGVMTRQGSRKAQWSPHIPGELAYLVRSGLPGQQYVASMRVLYGQLSAAQASYIVRKGTGGHTQGTLLIADGNLVFLQQSSSDWNSFEDFQHDHSSPSESLPSWRKDVDTGPKAKLHCVRRIIYAPWPSSSLCRKLRDCPRSRSQLRYPSSDTASREPPARSPLTSVYGSSEVWSLSD